MQRYWIVVEKAEGNYSAYCPDLPGCVATGRTRSQTVRSMRSAIRLHVKGLREDGAPIPKAYASAEEVTVDV